LGCTATDGSCVLLFTATDEAGNVNNTETLSITVDDVAPGVTLNSPVDGFNSSSQSVSFNATVSDTNDINNVTLFANFTGTWEANETNSSGQNNVEYVFGKSLSDGYYIWAIRACDQRDKCNISNNRTLTVDATPPVITNCNVNDTTLQNGESANLACEVTDSGKGVDTVLFFFNSQNETAVKDGGDFFNYTFTCSSSGDFVWNRTYANDTLDNLNSTTGQGLPFTITCDAQAPRVENATNNASGRVQLNDVAKITCDIEDPEANLDSVFLSIDRPAGSDTNETMVLESGNTYNITFLLDEAGTWNFGCYANDTAGNVNSTSVASSDPVFLNVTLNVPTPGQEKTVIQNKTFSINATV
jgi:hypothetical protein